MKNYNITEEQIKTIYSDGCTYVKEWFPEVFETKLEVGKWYKWENGAICYHSEYKGDYGFNSNKEWIQHNHWLTNGCNDGFKPATDSEVLEALKNEAVKRGYLNNFEGISCLCDFDKKKSQEYYKNPKNTFYYEKHANKLWIQDSSYLDICVFDKGNWATIIPTLTKEEAEKKLNVKIV